MSNPDLAGRYKMPWGYIDVVTNEVSIVSTVEDPPKVRLGATAGGSLGCLSFNRVRADGNQDEVALLQGKIDERYRSVAEGGSAQQTELVGEFRFDIKKPQRNGETDDKATIPVLQLQHDRIVCHRMLVNANGAPLAGGSSYANDMWSPNGLMVTQQQDDGNFVTYRLSRPYDKGASPVAVWSAWSGPTGR